jgi:hypothetical protein
MNARRLARWALRAALIGALAAGAVYTAHAASADEPLSSVTDSVTDGAQWGMGGVHAHLSVDAAR